jgi:AhpD family alkylhydroperoxidase
VEENIEQVAKEFKVTLGKLKKETPEVTDSLLSLIRSVHKEGVLSSKQKQLCCVGIALCTRCEPCIILHVRSAIEAGATRQELIETCAVALMMGGSQVAPYTSLIFKILDEHSQKQL